MYIRFDIKTWTLSALAGVWLCFFVLFNRWPEEFRGGDPWGYYIHLPATFIYHDVGDYSRSIAATQAVWPGENLSTNETPIGRHCNKYPLGVAFLLLPFFLVAHVFSLLTGWFPADGFSAPYALLAGLAPMVYGLAGMGLLYNVLRRYFPAGVAALVIALLGLATNLFYFTAYNNLMSHAFLFALYCLLLHVMHRFEDQPGAVRAAWLGAVVGLIALTRLHSVIVAIVPLLWGVHSWSSLGQRVQFLARHYRLLLVAAVSFAFVLSPQLIYYQFVSGQWLYYAYQGESFDFAHPRILDGLFSYSNGWLLYTPVMVFALLGILRLPKAAPVASASLLVFLPLYLYITYSWWCWNYINGFGSRPMVDTYPLLAIPLGAFLHWGYAYNWKKFFNVLLAVCFALLNVFQIWQLHKGLIWTEAGTNAHYWAMFGRMRSTPEALIAYDSNEPQPSRPPSFVRTLLDNPMEDSSAAGVTRDLKHGGEFGVRVEEEFAGTVATDPLQDLRPGDWIRVSVWGYMRREEHQILRDQQALLVLEMRNPDGQTLRHRGIKISSKIGNPDHTIWSTGEPDQWGEAAFFVKVPPQFVPGGQLKAYVWNPARQKIYVDDLRVDIYR